MSETAFSLCSFNYEDKNSCGNGIYSILLQHNKAKQNEYVKIVNGETEYKIIKMETKKHPIRKILLALFAMAIVAGCIFSHYGGFGTGQCADTSEFAKYAHGISEISVPAQARVVALGEATHGNAEFQQLKLDVFKVMVEKYGVRAFALEGDYGGCEAVNRYIHGGEGTAQEAVAAIGFPIYRTEQMEQLVSWMRDYNVTASEEDQLCFYGFDMQRYEYNYKYLLDAAREFGLDTKDLEQIWDGEKDGFSDASKPDENARIFEVVKQELMQLNDSLTAKAVHHADVLLQNISVGKLINDAAAGNALRDKFMADNVCWILEQEQARGNERIFVSAHNGHIQRFNNYGTIGKGLGNLLADKFGEGYFAIGTDFFKARVSLPKGQNHNNRSNHTFYSYDPLAKASKKCGYEMSWLDFSTIPEDSPLKQQIAGYTWMGSVGEGYSPLMAVLPMAYRIWVSPTELHDGLILVSNAHPTVIR